MAFYDNTSNHVCVFVLIYFQKLCCTFLQQKTKVKSSNATCHEPKNSLFKYALAKQQHKYLMHKQTNF